MNFVYIPNITQHEVLRTELLQKRVDTILRLYHRNSIIVLSIVSV